jgi:hypothetical protein
MSGSIVYLLHNIGSNDDNLNRDIAAGAEILQISLAGTGRNKVIVIRFIQVPWEKDTLIS